MKSMTGYGRSRFADEEHEIEAEIKSVNNRFLDIKYRLPRQLSFLEKKIDTEIKNVIKRGSIQLSINVTHKNGLSVSLNEANLKHYWQLYSQAASLLSIKNETKLNEILAESEVIEQKEADFENPEFQTKLIDTFLTALKEHQKMALQEGEAMRCYLQKSTAIMRDCILRLKTHLPEYKDDLFQKMKANIEQMLHDKLDEDALKRIMLEAAVYLEKADVTEEIVRLQDHIERFDVKVRENDLSAGKTLNFILQEMHREINTIGSKFNSTLVFEDIILIKEEIEKCREIVQNVE